jgi:DNA repair ATPase RecN
MVESYTKAQFWKCALQVNPAGYIAYRGQSHGMTEDEYNNALVNAAIENNIKIIGLANHGSVVGLDAIRTAMNQQGIIVFPGFEISSTEKAHFVCLFSEETTTEQLNRYLGNLGLTNPEDGIWPSNHSGNDIIKEVDDLGGFVYAAHCTDDSGILNKKLVHIWQNSKLKAVQIPGPLDDLKNEEENKYRIIISNKDPAYTRDLPIGIINAKDVAKPNDLSNPKTSCLIKMTKPSFDSFKLAFQDAESRVRLNSDVQEKYYSCLENLKITGGYLDGVEIGFSEHLNTVIGGRGTGKSTLIESLRYVLGLKPISKNAQKQHEDIISENVGKAKARIELKVRSSKMNGKRFTIARRYGENTSIFDEEGNSSSFLPSDILPKIEIYGQNEILDIAQDKSSWRQLLSRFLESSQQNDDENIQLALKKLADNRQKLVEAQEKIAAIEDEVSRLPKLEEQVGIFKTLGLEDKLEIVPLLETEKQLLRRGLEEEIPNLESAFNSVSDSLPDTTFLSDITLDKLPHADILRKLKKELDGLHDSAKVLLIEWNKKYSNVQKEIEKIAQELNSCIKGEEDKLEDVFKSLSASEGKTGKQIGIEYQGLLKEIERIRPKKTAIENHKKLVVELQKQRQAILDELSKIRTNRSSQFSRSLKKLNKRLEDKLHMEVVPEADRQPIINYLLGCNLAGIGEGRLTWIKDAKDFSPVKLAQVIRDGTTSQHKPDWGITDAMANALVRLSADQVFQLEELELPDLINIELNTAHEGGKNFKPLDKLSSGQKCTAILHLLLLENVDPLIMDQPEDNLDNAFIADRIVVELRHAKIGRQFLFATHNANIPVFGDAEWIGVFEASDNQAQMPPESQGAIDITKVRDKAAVILEGGKAAFNQRKAKYGF